MSPDRPEKTVDVELQSLLGQEGHHQSRLMESPIGTSDDCQEEATSPTAVQRLGSQIFLVAIFRSTQPLFFLVVAPFINQMLVYDLQVADEVHVGHYSGIVESAAAVGMCIGSFVCAHYSDIYGRKPITIGGVLISSVISAAFGFVRRYWLLVVMRFAMGLAISAQAATTKVMVSELSNMNNMAQNLIYSGMGWQLGATLSPMLGGVLAKPAETWPAVFSQTIFDRYPYGLPTLATAVVPAMAAIAAIWLLDETHPRLRLGPEKNMGKEEGIPKSCRHQERGILKSLLRLCREKVYPQNGLPPLFSCGEGFMLFFWFLQVFQIVSLQVTELLLFFSSPGIGGLGLTQSQMSMYLTLRPLAIILYEATIFGRVSKRAGGTVALLRWLVWLTPVLYLLYLLMSSIALSDELDGAIIIVGLAISLAVQVVSNSVFLCGDILIPARSPTVEQLSTCNALSEIVGQTAVGLGASIGSSLYAKSAALSEGQLKGRMVWVVLFATSMVTAMVGQRFTHVDGWREKMLYK